jgi:hypothetical protein
VRRKDIKQIGADLITIKKRKVERYIEQKKFNAVSRECIIAVVVVVVVLRFVEIMQEGRKASFCDHVALL